MLSESGKTCKCSVIFCYMITALKNSQSSNNNCIIYALTHHTLSVKIHCDSIYIVNDMLIVFQINSKSSNVNITTPPEAERSGPTDSGSGNLDQQEQSLQVTLK
jgi:hypothetical protein